MRPNRMLEQRAQKKQDETFLQQVNDLLQHETLTMAIYRDTLRRGLEQNTGWRTMARFVSVLRDVVVVLSFVAGVVVVLSFCRLVVVPVGGVRVGVVVNSAVNLAACGFR